jgi:hypothetical protein
VNRRDWRDITDFEHVPDGVYVLGGNTLNHPNGFVLSLTNGSGLSDSMMLTRGIYRGITKTWNLVDNEDRLTKVHSYAEPEFLESWRFPKSRLAVVLVHAYARASHHRYQLYALGWKTDREFSLIRDGEVIWNPYTRNFDLNSCLTEAFTDEHGCPHNKLNPDILGRDNVFVRSVQYSYVPMVDVGSNRVVANVEWL